MRSDAPLLCLAVFLLVACTAGPSSSGDPQDELPTQELAWENSALEDYRFEFQQQCFCVREQVQPVTIEVRGGRIERVISNETGQDLSTEPNLSWYTVPDLFNLIAEAQANETEPLVVTYDAQFGYPTRIEIGSLAADAGVIYTASNLVPL